MRYELTFTKEATKTLKKYKKSNPAIFKKVATLLNEISDHPRTGTGHPEPLVKGSDIRYSRHLTANIRIIYDIHDERIVVDIISMDSHYNDK